VKGPHLATPAARSCAANLQGAEALARHLTTETTRVAEGVEER